MAESDVESKKDIEKKEESYVYELGFHLLPTIPEEKLPEAVGGVKSGVEHAGGVLIAEEFPKLIELAYAITPSYTGGKESFDSAYFGWIKFESARNKVAELQDVLAKNANILRYIIVNTVRESTLAPRRAMLGKTEAESKKVSKKATPPRKSEPSASSEKEIDKAVEELARQAQE